MKTRQLGKYFLPWSFSCASLGGRELSGTETIIISFRGPLTCAGTPCYHETKGSLSFIRSCWLSHLPIVLTQRQKTSDRALKRTDNSKKVGNGWNARFPQVPDLARIRLNLSRNSFFTKKVTSFIVNWVLFESSKAVAWSMCGHWQWIWQCHDNLAAGHEKTYITHFPHGWAEKPRKVPHGNDFRWMLYPSSRPFRASIWKKRWREFKERRGNNVKPWYGRAYIRPSRTWLWGKGTENLLTQRWQIY